MPRVRFSVSSRGTTRDSTGRLEARLREIVSATTDRLRGVVELIAPVGPSFVRSNGTVHEGGFLRDHVSAQVSDDGFAGTVGWLPGPFLEAGDPPYYMFQELGTRFAPAQPSLGPAFDEVAPQFRAEVEQAVADAARGAR